MIIISSKEQFEKEIKTGKVIVDFFATWCSPCRMLSPVLEELASKGEIKVLKVNVDEQVELASMFFVSSIPFLVFYKDGIRVGDNLGYVNIAKLEKITNEVFQ